MKALSKATAWDNAEGFDEVSAHTFNAVFGLSTVFLMAVYAAFISMFLTAKLTTMEIILLCVVAFGGCFVAAIDSIGAKLVGGIMVAGGLGAITGPFVNQYKVASVLDVALETVLLVLILGFIGWIVPKSLENWGPLLLTWLLALIVVQILAPITYVILGLPLKGLTHTLDWVGIIIFSGFVVFDFNRAQRVPKTIENAIWCGTSVFLDVANLFIRILELTGQLKTGDD